MVGGDKTTVSRLAARFWDINKGRITIGGMNVSKIDPEALICGGILTGIWMWSGHASASIISTPFVRTVFLISPQYLFLTVNIFLFFYTLVRMQSCSESHTGVVFCSM